MSKNGKAYCEPKILETSLFVDLIYPSKFNHKCTFWTWKVTMPFCSANDNVQRIREGENISKDTSDKGPLSKTHKEVLKLTIWKWAKVWKKTSQKTLRRTKKHMKTVASHMSSRKCKLQQWDAIIYLLEQPKSGTLLTRNAGGKWNDKNSHSLLVRMPNRTATWGGSLTVTYRANPIFTIWSSKCALWHLNKGAGNLCQHKCLHKDVYSSLIHDYQNLGANKVYCRRWIDNQNCTCRKWN